MNNFSTPRLKLRIVDDDATIDDSIITDIFSDSVTRYLPSEWKGLNKRDKAAEWIQNKMRGAHLLSMTNLQSNSVVGFLFVYPDDSMDANLKLRIGYVLGEADWGKGYASEMIAGLIVHCAGREHVAEILAGVEPKNIPSAKVLIKNGFLLHEQADDLDTYRYHF